MTDDPTPWLSVDDVAELTERARQRRRDEFRRARLNKWTPSSPRVARAARALDRALSRTLQPRDDADYLDGIPARYEPADYI